MKELIKELIINKIIISQIHIKNKKEIEKNNLKIEKLELLYKILGLSEKGNLKKIAEEVINT